MKLSITFLSLLCIVFSSIANDEIKVEENTSEIQNSTPELPRELSDIKVEMDEPKKKKIKARKLKLKPKENGSFKVDDFIKKFKLDEDLNQKETDDFFTKLENSIYKNMKSSLYKQKKYVQNYSEIVQEYQRLSTE